MFFRRCRADGTLLVAAGLAIDFVLFLVWGDGDLSTPRSFGHASLAQSLIFAGGTLATFGIVSCFQPARAIPHRADPHADATRAPARRLTASASRPSGPVCPPLDGALP